MKIFHKFIQKLVLGGYSIKFNNRYVSFPKASLFMITSILLLSFFSTSSILFWLGLIICIIGIFGGFFYQRIFKKETAEYLKRLREKLDK